MTLLQGVVLCRIASGKSKCKQVITARMWYLVFGLKTRGYCKHIFGLMVRKSDYHLCGPQSLPGRGDMNLLFVWCGEPSVKKQWRERQET